MILVIDNYDSFTYNLVHYLNELGAETEVVRNDALTVQDALALRPDAVLLSPGPCAPDQAGICLPLLRAAPESLPILGVCFGPVLIKPRARGKVFLRSHLPDAKPRVLSNFLAEEEDRQLMIAGIRMALEIAGKAPLADLLRAPYRVPASDSADDVLAFVRSDAMTVFHPTSTCAIGAVVDSELRVHGVEGLRVVDASVFPRVPGLFIVSAVYMIGEKAADVIAAQHKGT